jgi:RNA polymerase sigma factor (sigma-70 family)
MPQPLDASLLADRVAAMFPALHAFVRLKMGPLLRAREASVDVAQSVCARALADLPRAHFAERDLKAWLFDLAARHIVDKARFHQAARRDVGREVPLRRDSSVSDPGLLACYSSILTPSRFAMGHEMLARFEQAFEELSPADQTVILGVCIEGRTHADVAQQMGRTPGAVRVLLLRARDRLRRLMRS